MFDHPHPPSPQIDRPSPSPSSSSSSPLSSPSPQTPPASLALRSPLPKIPLSGKQQNHPDNSSSHSSSSPPPPPAANNDRSQDSNSNNPDNSDASSRPSGSNQVVLAMDTPSASRQPNQPPGGNVGKGGCWTCRIRRKKCDEQRVGDSCQTCIRLRIDCLGWGPKRPQWMRDKQAVERYKAGIKEKLIKAGMVRGQPRLAHNNAARSSSTSTNTTSPPTAFPGSQTQPPYQHPQPPSQSYGHPHGQQHRTQSSPAAFGGIGAMGGIGPVVALGVMGGDATSGNLSSSSTLGYEFSTQRHSPHMHGQSHRYGPYPSPHITAQQQLTPHASAVMDAEYSELDPFLGIAPEAVGQMPDQRRASIGAIPVTHSQQRRVQSYPQQMSNTSFGLSPGQAFGVPNMGPHTTSPFDFPNSSFTGMESMSVINNNATTLEGLGVPGMNIPGSVHSSPLMIGDEGPLLPYNNNYMSSQQSHHSNPPISRPPSGSASSSTSGSVHGLASSPQFSDPLSEPSLVDPHIQYYLKDVLPLQFPFACDNARVVMQNLFTQDPQGALVNASCALAAKHNKMVRVARMLDPPDAVPSRSTAQQFFDRALWQINMNGGGSMASSIPVANVLASLQLVGFFLLQGGSGAWQMHLNVALAWLGSTAICAPDNEKPGETLRSLNESDLLAAKLTIWYDIFSAISLQTAPRYISVYRRLFSGTISRVQDSTSANFMDSFMGCPDDIMLALAETAELANWKAICRQQGTLNIHDLRTRGVQIQERLVMSTIAESFPPMLSTGTDVGTGATASQMHSSHPSEDHVNPSPMVAGLQLGRGEDVNAILNVAGASTSSGAPTPATMTQTLASVSPQPHYTGLDQQQIPMFGMSSKMNTSTAISSQNEHRRLVSQVFLHTASLYLASIVNESSPGVPEVTTSLNALFIALQALEGKNVDRILALPFMLLGCLTVQPEHYQFSIKRLATLDPAFGNVHNVKLLINQMWSYRNMQSVDTIDWCDMMQTFFGGAILFV